MRGCRAQAVRGLLILGAAAFGGCVALLDLDPGFRDTSDAGTENASPSLCPLGGECPPGEPPPLACSLADERGCEDGQVRECSAEGTWLLARCPEGQFCERGGCVSTCTEGATQCNANREVQVCRAGAFEQLVACDSVCVATQGEAQCSGVCKPGAERCSPEQDGVAESCDATGNWQAREACKEPAGICSGGRCMLCEPGSVRCGGNLPQRCGAQGSGWEDQPPCADPTPTCIPGSGACGVCSAGDRRSCVGSQGNCAAGEQVCGPDFNWGECSVLPLANDSCDSGDDANCNGRPNEGCTCVEAAAPQPCGPLQPQGSCQRGSSSCGADGQWGDCVGARNPAPRDCLVSADDDCNGEPDNTIDDTCKCVPESSESCGEHPGLDGAGICSAGSRTCIAAAGRLSSDWGPCTGSVGPRPRNCLSALDNDCNGIADNQEAACACQPGETQACGSDPASNGCRRGEQTCSLSADRTTAGWGFCTLVNQPDGMGCDDGNPTTTQDACRGGSCRGFVCFAGQFQCTGATLQRCNAERSGFDNVRDCLDLGGYARAGRPEARLCDAANGRCLTCVPGSSRCSVDVAISVVTTESCQSTSFVAGARIARCNPDGLGEVVQACDQNGPVPHCRGPGSTNESVPNAECFGNCTGCSSNGFCASACDRGYCATSCCF